ncbi:hypothetical protein ACYCU1_36195 [Bradyrhizobium sp. 5.13L]
MYHSMMVMDPQKIDANPQEYCEIEDLRTNFEAERQRSSAPRFFDLARGTVSDAMSLPEIQIQ